MIFWRSHRLPEYFIQFIDITSCAMFSIGTLDDYCWHFSAKEAILSPWTCILQRDSLIQNFGNFASVYFLKNRHNKVQTIRSFFLQLKQRNPTKNSSTRSMAYSNPILLTVVWWIVLFYHRRHHDPDPVLDRYKQHSLCLMPHEDTVCLELNRWFYT